MPLYDYNCLKCGPFNDVQPMDAYDADKACPDCGAPSARALLSVPHFGSSRSRFKAQAINERASHAPDTTVRSGRHPSNCGCCKPSKAPAKGFPGTRPWMLSH